MATSFLYTRVTLTAGEWSIIHAAELEPLDAHHCRIRRMVEMQTATGETTPHTPSNTTITGRLHVSADGTVTNSGMNVPPELIVAHPDSYADFPDVTVASLSAGDFDELWAAAGKLSTSHNLNPGQARIV